MRAFIGAVILSIVSAIVAVFAVTELCEKTITTGRSADAIRERTTHTTPQQPKQKIRQWVNY